MGKTWRKERSDWDDSKNKRGFNKFQRIVETEIEDNETVEEFYDKTYDLSKFKDEPVKYK
jgi:hypothetical protein